LVAVLLSSAETSLDDGGLLILLIDDVRLIPPDVAPVTDDMAVWVEDLEIALEPGMTVDEPDEVEVV